MRLQAAVGIYAGRRQSDQAREMAKYAGDKLVGSIAELVTIVVVEEQIPLRVFVPGAEMDMAAVARLIDEWLRCE